jgi:exodeoxyribonuclease VII large subunit
MSERKLYGVLELTRLIKASLEQSFGQVWIEGEISNVRRPSSGHYYFTIKDENAQISAVLFRGNQRGMQFELKDGLLVQALGDISVYERSGSYQIIVRQIEEAGKGSLQAAFEALKKKLYDEGLFDEARKKPLPLLPQHVGVVTSPTGAAVRDILKVISRRFPNLHVVIAPVKVQGERAAAEVARGIAALNELGGLDAMIVGRGGGSLEDLWCFNEEVVARAIAASEIPVISAVGHEIDFTISDFVADMRAPTPSAAAEQLVSTKDVLESQISDARNRLLRTMKESLLSARHKLQGAAKSHVFIEPGTMVAQQRQKLSEMRMSMERMLEDQLRSSEQRVDEANLSITHLMQSSAASCRQDLKRVKSQLRALNPNAVLTRGYSITRDEKGGILSDAAELKKGQKVKTTLAKGEFESEVI